MPSFSLPTVAIIGAGRVGAALARALVAADYPLLGIASRSPAFTRNLAESLHISISTPADLVHRADLTFLTVPDDVLPLLATELSLTRPQSGHQAVVHCSGALSADVLAPLAAAGWLTGGCHPLAPFASRESSVPLGITWGIEAAEPLRTTLQHLATNVGGVPLDIRAEDKVLYHAAAVLAANFAITLAARAVEVLGLCAIAPEAALAALLPLLRGNLDNLAQVGIPTALTGPLARGDWPTVERHLAALDARAPDIAALYRACVAGTGPLIEKQKAKS